MFSRRLPPHVDLNALTQALARRRLEGAAVVDLTESNPTRVGLTYPPDLLRGLADPSALRYEPQPFGLASARAAVARDHARRSTTVDPANVVLTASTSEAYTWLFKLLCNPGESVLVPRPSYPLFEHLTRLEGVETAPYGLEYHGRWEIDFDAIASAPTSVRAAIVVSPNNPTGSFISRRDFNRLSMMCRERAWTLIADEVFADYPLETDSPCTDLAVRSDALAFTLGGLSKSVGLPQLKLGWIVAGGPDEARRAALAGLELIADSFLSVGTPVQAALPELLDGGSAVREQIRARVRGNLRALREIARSCSGCEVLRAEGGWSAVIRVPATRTEEQLVLDVLRREGILVHPGYFFDLPREAFIVVSLLPEPDAFADAAARLLRFASC
jgi:alanine-synthesizing transaminase